jgi:hypothetical protein
MAPIITGIQVIGINSVREFFQRDATILHRISAYIHNRAQVMNIPCNIDANRSSCTTGREHKDGLERAVAE